MTVDISIIQNQFAVVLMIEFFILLTPLIFIIADLFAGLRKARIRGESITSRKFRDTIAKMARYYNVLFVLCVLDIMQLSSIWYMNTFEEWSLPIFPWMTLIGSAGVGLIEIKSILEPADEKEGRQMREITALAKAIAEHKMQPQDIAKELINYLDKNKA